MSAEKLKSTEKKQPKMLAGELPSQCLEDPQFIKVLATSLLSEIAALELALNESDAEVKVLKENVAKGLEKRKALKDMIQIMSRKKLVAGTALESLERETKYRSIEVETVKNRLDDATLRDIADRDKYKKILENYQETWQNYKETYEAGPLAKKRQESRLTLKHLSGQHMMAQYKKESLIKMMKQRKEIDNTRAKASIVGISKMILQRWQDQSHVQHLNANIKQLQNELDAYTAQLTQLEQEEERKRRAETESSLMPPPRLDFSFMRSICNEEDGFHKRKYSRIDATRDSDAVSINTLLLEEMCITPNDEAAEGCGKETETVEDEEENSLIFPSSVSMIQELEPITSIADQADRTLAPESTMNQSNFRSKQKKPLVERKITFALDKEQQREAESKVDNNHFGGTGNEGDGYNHNSEESDQRIRQWCENSQNKFASFALAGRRSSSWDERTPDDSDQQKYAAAHQIFAKASSIHGSEIRSLHQDEGSFKASHAAQLVSEPNHRIGSKNFDKNAQMEMQDQRKRPSGENLGRDAPAEVATPRSKEREPQHQRETPSSTATAPTHDPCPYETPNQDPVSKPSEDNSQLPIDASCSRPKIRKLETVNFPLSLRLKEVATANDSHQPAVSNSPSEYVPSCMSSNLSNMFEAALQEMPQDALGGGEKSAGTFPSLSNWKNWSPPRSEASLASSISKIGVNKEATTNEKRNPSKDQNQPTDFNISSFFSMKPSQNPGNIF